MNALSPLMADIDFAMNEVPDLYALYDRLRDYGPVAPIRFMGQPAWAILGHAELDRAYNDPENFSPHVAYRRLQEPSMGRALMTLVGEEHRQTRAMVTPAFVPSMVRSCIQALIEPVAHEVLDRIAAREEVDLVREFAQPFPFTVITRLLGIPVDDEALFLRWAVKLIDYPWDPEGALQAKEEFGAYMLRIIEERRRIPGEDFVSKLVQAEHEGRRLDDEQLLALFRFLFPAGSDTTYKNVGSLFAAVLGDPAMRALAAKGDAERAALVLEALRWEAPAAMMPRIATGSTELGGVRIREGDWVAFAIAAANNDPVKFADPRRFDPARDNRDLISFGRGAHFCVGMHLALRELETALRVVLQRFPALRLKPDAPVEMIGGVMRGPRALWVELGA